jgi:hypothetical protein
MAWVRVLVYHERDEAAKKFACHCRYGELHVNYTVVEEKEVPESERFVRELTRKLISNNMMYAASLSNLSSILNWSITCVQRVDF